MKEVLKGQKGQKRLENPLRPEHVPAQGHEQPFPLYVPDQRREGSAYIKTRLEKIISGIIKK